MEIQTGFIDKQRLMDSKVFISYHPTPSGLSKNGFIVYLVNSLLQVNRHENILIIVTLNLEADELVLWLGLLKENVCLFQGGKRPFQARISIITTSSFGKLKDTSEWSTFIFYTIGKKKPTIITKFILNTGSTAFGLTNSYYGINRTPKYSLPPDTELLKRLKRSKSMTQKEVVESFDVFILKKEHLWFKSGNFISININEKLRLVGHTELIFDGNRVKEIVFRLFAVRGSIATLIPQITSKAEAYAYTDNMPDKPLAIHIDRLNEGAFISQSSFQETRILNYLEVTQTAINNLEKVQAEVTSNLAIIIIAGLEEKMFRMSATFGKIKNIIKDLKVSKYKPKIEPFKEEPDLTPKLTPKENETMSEHVTLETLKNVSDRDLRTKLLDLSIELVQQEDNDAKKLTLELLKYLKNK